MRTKRITIYLNGVNLSFKRLEVQSGNSRVFATIKPTITLNLRRILANTRLEYLAFAPKKTSLIKAAFMKGKLHIQQNGFCNLLSHLLVYKINVNLNVNIDFKSIKIKIEDDGREVWTSRQSIISGVIPYALNHSQEYDFARFQDSFAAFVWGIESHQDVSDVSYLDIDNKSLIESRQVDLAKNIQEGILIYHQLPHAEVAHGHTVLKDCFVFPIDLHNYLDGSWPTDSVFKNKEGQYIFNNYSKHSNFKGSYCFFGSSTSWFHFLIEIFPRYLIFDQSLLADCTPIIESKMPAQIIEVLSLLCKNKPLVLEPSQLAELEILHTCTEARYPGGLDLLNRAADIKLVQAFFSERFKLSEKKGQKRVFITRNTSLFRRSDRVSMLAKSYINLGFDVVDTGELTMQEQVILFASADVVVGETGSSLTNLIFCKANTKVFEINLFKFMPGFFKEFCNVLGLEHFVVEGIDVKNNQNLLQINGRSRNIVDILGDF